MPALCSKCFPLSIPINWIYVRIFSFFLISPFHLARKLFQPNFQLLYIKKREKKKETSSAVICLLSIFYLSHEFSSLYLFLLLFTSLLRVNVHLPVARREIRACSSRAPDRGSALGSGVLITQSSRDRRRGSVLPTPTSQRRELFSGPPVVGRGRVCPPAD